MQIRNMFVKDIDRDIKGVIKVGQADDENVKQELEEYVVTRELQKHFADFFASYKKGIVGNTDKMGVWISGFFGSGKSHFLKILSYLVENRVVDGKAALDYFIEDNKIKDEMVLADMKLAANTSADVILFNIDSKSGMADTQNNKEAILSVFLKVFNQQLGFYGANPHLADLERNLAEEGKYEDFKNAFAELRGKEWVDSRHQFRFIQDYVCKALVKIDYMRRRVKEQLKKIGGMEFYDVNFSYVDNDTFEEHYVPIPEQGGGKLIPEGMGNPGNIYTVSRGKSGMVGVFRLETQMLPGNGKFERTGLGTDREAKEATNTALNFLKANGSSISGSISTTTKDYIINYQDLNGIGITKYLTLPSLIAICSAALSKPTLSSLAVLGDISISGTVMKVEELANVLQVCLDSGAKKVLLPITSAADLGTVPAELMGAFSIIFYNTPQEAVFKALGVD